MLLAHVSGVPAGILLADRQRGIGARAAAAFRDLVARRATREPLQHLVGRWPFLDFELRVDRRALVPRQETELLAAWAIDEARARGARRVADVGTGSGCLAIALARGVPGVRVVAVDASAAALSLARENVREHGLAGRVALVRGCLVEALGPGAVDLIVANLPYVAEDEHATLEPEVRDHDPREALVAADGGFATIARLVDRAAAALAPRGALLLEFDPRQAERLRALCARRAWQDVVLRDDFSGRPRCARAVRPAEPVGAGEGDAG
ncbi:MAG: peptide chain release factor N(5)-glutamine methyltransferase [Acidobacteriota bacterium]